MCVCVCSISQYRPQTGSIVHKSSPRPPTSDQIPTVGFSQFIFNTVEELRRFRWPVASQWSARNDTDEVLNHTLPWRWCVPVWTLLAGSNVCGKRGCFVAVDNHQGLSHPDNYERREAGREWTSVAGSSHPLQWAAVARWQWLTLCRREWRRIKHGSDISDGLCTLLSGDGSCCLWEMNSSRRGFLVSFCGSGRAAVWVENYLGRESEWLNCTEKET